MRQKSENFTDSLGQFSVTSKGLGLRVLAAEDGKSGHVTRFRLFDARGRKFHSSPQRLARRFCGEIEQQRVSATGSYKLLRQNSGSRASGQI